MDKSTHKFQDRSKARELALEYLYQWFLLEKQVCDTAAEFVYHKENISEKGKDFARIIINGVIEKIKEIEEIISNTAKNWSINRMMILDRVILCIGTYEIMFMKNIPDRVSINEAIELAKKYSSVKSFAFVNGILDKISKRSPTVTAEPNAEPSTETTAEPSPEPNAEPSVEPNDEPSPDPNTDPSHEN